jgi:hypothetical protein
METLGRALRESALEQNPWCHDSLLKLPFLTRILQTLIHCDYAAHFRPLVELFMFKGYREEAKSIRLITD